MNKLEHDKPNVNNRVSQTTEMRWQECGRWGWAGLEELQVGHSGEGGAEARGRGGGGAEGRARMRTSLRLVVWVRPHRSSSKRL